MQTGRLKTALLAGSLSTIAAAAIAATAPAPAPVAKDFSFQVAQAMRNPCGAGSPCAPGARTGDAQRKPVFTGDQRPRRRKSLRASLRPRRQFRLALRARQCPEPLLARIGARRAAGKPVCSGQPLRTGSLLTGPDAAEASDKAC